MFEISIERTFSAAHAIVMNGEREAVHGHDWTVTVVVAGDQLDSDGLLCDFHALENALDRVIAPFRNTNLNATYPFDTINPTAEHVAQHIGDELHQHAFTPHAPRAHIHTVTITEAPGCRATYHPKRHKG